MRGPIILCWYCSDNHEFGIGIKFDVFYAMEAKRFVTSLTTRNSQTPSLILLKFGI